ncbi:hypothetical protein LEA_03094, partial [human gut metagenome]
YLPSEFLKCKNPDGEAENDTHIRNSPAALSNKNRQKKNRKGSVTFTVIGI